MQPVDRQRAICVGQGGWASERADVSEEVAKRNAEALLVDHLAFRRHEQVREE